MALRRDHVRRFVQSDFESADRHSIAAAARPFARFCEAFFRETLDTLILGALSTSIGTVLVILTVRGAFRPKVLIDVPQINYVILVTIGASLGIIGMVRACQLGRYTSPLSALGAVLCFSPIAVQILSSAGIYLLIVAPFAIVYYAAVTAEKLLHWIVRKSAPSDKDSESNDWDRAD